VAVDDPRVGDGRAAGARLRLTNLKPRLPSASLSREIASPAPDAWRGRKGSAERGYNFAWQKARLLFLKRNPLCAFCAAQGRVGAASVVDHIVPHKGDDRLFWDESNWQPLCVAHHSSDKQRMERRRK
jgi:5-methylcytosine-specific restriction enzyme A